MNRGTSLYLDVARIAAALMVFSEHAREHTRNSFNWFWKLHPSWVYWSDPFALVAGMVVFVLSGYVIAHVLATREKTLVEFTASRLARLYSIMIPALLLAMVTNYMEALRYPTAFDSYANLPMALRYLGSSLFLTHYWVLPGLGVPNMPFWRLSYEVCYYIGIAIFVFARGPWRIVSLGVLCLLAGPSMVLMAPTWLVGYAVYHVAQKYKPSATLSLLLFVVSWVGLLYIGPHIQVRFRHHFDLLTMPDNTSGGVVAAYVEAICFAVNILAVDVLTRPVELLLAPFAKIIRWLAATTFALYMFHQPILSFFTVYPVGTSYEDRSSLAQAALLIGGTFLVVATLGHFFERRKGPYKRFLLNAWGTIRPPRRATAEGDSATDEAAKA